MRGGRVSRLRVTGGAFTGEDGVCELAGDDREKKSVMGLVDAFLVVFFAFTIIGRYRTGVGEQREISACKCQFPKDACYTVTGSWPSATA